MLEEKVTQLHIINWYIPRGVIKNSNLYWVVGRKLAHQTKYCLVDSWKIPPKPLNKVLVMHRYMLGIRRISIRCLGLPAKPYRSFRHMVISLCTAVGRGGSIRCAQ